MNSVTNETRKKFIAKPRPLQKEIVNDLSGQERML